MKFIHVQNNSVHDFEDLGQGFFKHPSLKTRVSELMLNRLGYRRCPEIQKISEPGYDLQFAGVFSGSFTTQKYRYSDGRRHRSKK